MTWPVFPRNGWHRLVFAAWLAMASQIHAAPAPWLAIDFIDSPGTLATAINRRGDVVGEVAEWPCDDQQCAPAYIKAVWTADGVRHELPTLGSLPMTVAGISDSGVAVGTLTDFGSISHAVIWQLVGGSYQVTDLGLLPGTTRAAAMGIDAQGRVVGHATGGSGFKPFVWTASGGLVDLSTQGFPLDRPSSVSPSGWVVSDGYTYSLDDVGSVQPLPAAPQGFITVGYGMKINDKRELAGFLGTTSGEHLAYLHRFRPADGQWQLLSGSPSGHLSRWGMGSINADATVVATVTSQAVIAEGPDGVAQSLNGQLSPAYPETSVTDVGQRNGKGEMVAQALIGRSKRLVRLTPVAPCVGECVRASELAMVGKFIPDPDAPGSCTPKARNSVRATVTVKNAAGIPQAGVSVRGRFLDDYALNEPVSGKTKADGKLTFRHLGPACVGAVAFLVDSIKQPGAAFDRTTGQLTAYVIPLP